VSNLNKSLKSPVGCNKIRLQSVFYHRICLVKNYVTITKNRTLDKEATSYNHIFDFRLVLNF
jgi:hypothetical protein